MVGDSNLQITASIHKMILLSKPQVVTKPLGIKARDLLAKEEKCSIVLTSLWSNFIDNNIQIYTMGVQISSWFQPSCVALLDLRFLLYKTGKIINSIYLSGFLWINEIRSLRTGVGGGMLPLHSWCFLPGVRTSISIAHTASIYSLLILN